MSIVHILIVDDDPAACDGLAMLLGAEGFTTTTAESGEEALSLLERERFDVVLTDLQMPGINGVELCRRVRALDADVPVIVITAMTDVSAAVESLRAGAEDYLTKPLDLDAVRWCVQQAIERRAARLEREQMRRQSEALYHEALAKTRAYEAVLSAVAHDLRAPLGVIWFKAEEIMGLASHQRSEELSSAGQSILGSCKRMNLLLKNVLDEARRQGGQPTSSRSLHPLAGVLQDVAELWPIAAQKRVSLDIRPPERGLLVWCDRVRVGQVLANLVSNAIRFSPRGQSVHVSAARAPGGLCFEVRDHGPGIGPEAQPRLFERFGRAHEASDPTSHDGVGLGLFISRGIVEEHGGRIWVESEPGRGCTFSFFLPGEHALPQVAGQAPASERCRRGLTQARAAAGR